MPFDIKFNEYNKFESINYSIEIIRRWSISKILIKYIPCGLDNLWFENVLENLEWILSVTAV